MDETRVSFVDPAKTFIFAIFNRGGVIVVVFIVFSNSMPRLSDALGLGSLS